MDIFLGKVHSLPNTSKLIVDKAMAGHAAGYELRHTVDSSSMLLVICLIS